MRFENQTEFPALHQVADLGTDERFAVVIWKATYELGPKGSLRPAADPLPITGELIETDFGTFHGDIFLRKVGADLCVLGSIRCSASVDLRYLTLRCGSFEHSLRVSGDRVWQRKGLGDTLVPSSPAPFAEMDLSYRRAYGGNALYETLEAPSPDNPVGRGYYLERDDALGKPLPNIESARGPFVKEWSDKPAPVSWGPYPMYWGLRGSKEVTVDPERGAITRISPAIFNNAHPDLVLPEIAPGARVEVIGMRDEPVAFTIPKTLGRVQVEVGSLTTEQMTRIDAVHLWLDAARVVITQRANFRYRVQPLEVRTASLHRFDLQ
jgi:hypothetical protein